MACTNTGNRKNKFQDVLYKMPEQFHDEIPKIFRSDQTRIFRFGEKGSGLEFFHPEVQDFNSLKTDLLNNRSLFEDHTFDTINSSLYYSNQNTVPGVVWMRPSQIVKNPLFVNPAARKFSGKQLYTGNCGFVAALYNVTMNFHLFDQIIPEGQSFSNQYAGIFHFRFWQFGKWIDVVIDDFLPMSLEKIEFIQRMANPTFWSTLLEKAYAKLYGSYEAILEIYLNDSMVDLTGGTSDFNTPGEGEPAFEKLQEDFNHGTLMAATTKGISADKPLDESQPFQVDQPHTITAITTIENKTQEMVQLLKLKDTWSGNLKWKGPWSEGSPLWNTIANVGIAKQMKDLAKASGEFWMSYTDFRKYFNRHFLCYLDPKLLEDYFNPPEKIEPWQLTTIHNKWVPGSGGGDILHNTFWKNPQYAITLKIGLNGIRGQWLIVSLMQKYRKRSHLKNLEIGVSMFVIPPGKELPLKMEYIKSQFPMQKFNHTREITSRYILPAGKYCIIPSTAFPKSQCEFLLRIITENPITYTVHDQKVGTEKVDLRANHMWKDPPRLGPNVEKYFHKVAKETDDIDWLELKKLLDYALSSRGVCVNCPMFRKGPLLSKDACRSIVAEMDFEGDGRLSYKQFEVLWAEIHKWKAIYDQHCPNIKKRMPCSNLNEALHAAGFSLNHHILGIITNRYGSKALVIDFDDFVILVMRLKVMLYVFFENADPRVPDLTLEDWLAKTVYS